MTKKHITMDKISPIIRYAQTIIISDSTTHGNMIAYDNRLFLCLDGKGCIVVDGKKYPVERGTVIMWRAAVPYRYEPAVNSPFKLIGFNFDFTNNSEDNIIAIPPVGISLFDAAMLTENIEFTDVLSFNSTICLSDKLYLENKFFNIQNEFLYKKKFYMQRCRGMLMDLLVSLARSSQITFIQSNHNTANEIIAYIHNNYNQALSNEILSQKFGYHPGYIGRLIKSTTGLSTHQYILNYRIERAITYLQSGKKTVSETCFLCGFNDLAHFSKAFKLKTGYSPSRYCL